jgi:hypothetical protein
MALGSRKKAGDAITVKLVGGAYVLTSAANTALTTVQAVSPIAVSDFSSFAALYDLCRVTSVDVHYRVASSAAINGSVDIGLAWDPSNIGPYASLTDIMTAKHYHGPCTITGTPSQVSPAPVSSSGFWHMGTIGLMPRPVVNDGTAAAAIGGGWFGTSDTTAVIGWLKPYAAACGGAVTSTMVIYVTYTCQFKSRT